jgi:hypothetical protein
MPRWQYSILMFNNERGEIGALNLELAELGREGWEIAGIIPDAQYPDRHSRRPLQSGGVQVGIEYETASTSAVILKRPLADDEAEKAPPELRKIGFDTEPE